MAESDSGYQVGPGRPPLHSRFRKGQSGNPGGRSAKSLPVLLADALNETVVMTIDGRRRTITKREAIVAQMVNNRELAILAAVVLIGSVGLAHASCDNLTPPFPEAYSAETNPYLR